MPNHNGKKKLASAAYFGGLGLVLLLYCAIQVFCTFNRYIERTNGTNKIILQCFNVFICFILINAVGPFGGSYIGYKAASHFFTNRNDAVEDSYRQWRDKAIGALIGFILGVLGSIPSVIKTYHAIDEAIDCVDDSDFRKFFSVYNVVSAILIFLLITTFATVSVACAISRRERLEFHSRFFRWQMENSRGNEESHEYHPNDDIHVQVNTRGSIALPELPPYDPPPPYSEIDNMDFSNS